MRFKTAFILSILAAALTGFLVLSYRAAKDPGAAPLKDGFSAQSY